MKARTPWLYVHVVCPLFPHGASDLPRPSLYSPLAPRRPLLLSHVHWRLDHVAYLGEMTCVSARAYGMCTCVWLCAGGWVGGWMALCVRVAVWCGAGATRVMTLSSARGGGFKGAIHTHTHTHTHIHIHTTHTTHTNTRTYTHTHTHTTTHILCGAFMTASNQAASIQHEIHGCVQGSRTCHRPLRRGAPQRV
jgi:hypothetical protein